MSTDIVQNSILNEEEVFHDAADGFVNDEEKTAITKRSNPADAKEDDRTEDQVPDISGTENVADQMTISVDEVEEIPPSHNGEEVEESTSADQDGEIEQIEEPKIVDEDVVEIPIDVIDNAEAPIAAEGELVAEEVPETEPVPVEGEIAAEIQPISTVIDDEILVEHIQEEPVECIPEEPVVPTAKEAETAAIEEAALPAADDNFQLQDPPTPKRCKTPNELDILLVDVPITEMENADEENAQTPISSVKGSQPSTPALIDETVKDDTSDSPRRLSVFSTADSNVPKSPTESVRRESNVSEALKSPIASGSVMPDTPAPTTPHSSAAAQSPRTPKTGGETPKTKTEFVFEEASPVSTPKSPKKTTFDEDILSTASSKSKSPPKSPRSGRKVRRSRIIKSPEAEPEADAEAEVEIGADTTTDNNAEADAKVDEEPEKEMLAFENEVKPVVDIAEALVSDEPAAINKDKESPDASYEDSPIMGSARKQSPSPPPRVSAREAESRDYMPYDQDSHRKTVPPRLPTSTSFSSWVAPERETYQAISPWINTASKYRNEHTVGVTTHTPTYTAIFDDHVSTGPFSSNLYTTTRLLERSRSRTREHRNAMRSQRSASNYYRFASQFPPPLRTRDYSTPPTAISKTSSRAGSFISFMEFSAAKNFDVALSRGSLYDSNQALSHASSRGNIDYYLGAGRLSRVDSYVNNLNSRYEWHVPSNYEIYRSASRSRLSGYTPVNEYASYTNPLYEDALRGRNTGMVRSMYEGRIDDLQRNLSKERYERDRLRSRYAMVASQLEQACKQMDLLRTNSYSMQRSGSTPRTSVYGNFYPYY